MHIRNLTPHHIKLINQSTGEEVVLPPDPNGPARCVVSRVQVDQLLIRGVTIPIVKTIFGDVYNLPATVHGTRFIVSRPVAEALAGIRRDLLVPENLVRDEQGRIIGAGALAIYEPRER